MQHQVPPKIRANRTHTKYQLINLKTIAALVDADRTTVRRWLCRAKICPLAVGKGRNGAVRYRWRDIRQWLDTLGSIDDTPGLPRQT